MRRSGLFALLAVFVGLAFVPYASADLPWGWEGETQTQYSHVRSITWSGDSEYVAATSFDDDENGVSHSVAEMWDNTLEQHRVFGTEVAQPISAALNEDGSRLFTGLSTGEIALWDTESGALLQRMPAHKIAPQLVISNDRKWLVSWEEDSVIIWDASTLERHWLITHPAQARESVDFVFAVINRDSDTLAVGNSAGVVLFYDLESKKHISSLVTGESGKPYGAFYMDYGDLVLAYKPSILKFCDSNQCFEIPLDASIYRAVVGYVNQDELLVATTDGRLEARQAYPAIALSIFKSDVYNVSDMALSPDEVFFAAGAYPGRLIIVYAPVCGCSFEKTSPTKVM
jgi:WD40 repeat protein